MGGVVVVFGGRSEIGLAIAKRLAPEASTAVLAVRPNPDATGSAPPIAGAEVIDFDADDVATHRAVVADIESRFGPIDTAILAFAILGDQARAEADEAEADAGRRS